jgi:hypothetical protein
MGRKIVKTYFSGPSGGEMTITYENWTKEAIEERTKRLEALGYQFLYQDENVKPAWMSFLWDIKFPIGITLIFIAYLVLK